MTGQRIVDFEPRGDQMLLVCGCGVRTEVPVDGDRTFSLHDISYTCGGCGTAHQLTVSYECSECS